MKTTVLVDNLKFPESPRWHDGALWFADYATRRVLRPDLEGNVQTVTELPDLPTALDWTPDGRLLIVSASARRLLTLKDNTLVTVADMSTLVDYPCGELVVDTQGRCYNANIGYDLLKQGTGSQTTSPGSILLITPEGNVRTVADDLAFPNGMVITPDGKTLIVAESHAARVSAFTIEADGSLSSRRVWKQFDDNRMNPDGISLDAEGLLWVASPVTKEVVRVGEGGEIMDRVAVDGFPLACMLGNDRLFIAVTSTLNPADPSVVGRIEFAGVDVPHAGRP